MRALANVYSSFLDLIENTRWGTAGFRLARFGLFAMVIFVGSRIASRRFLSFDFSDILFMAITALAFLVIYARWEIGIAAVLATTSFIAYYDVMPTLSLYHFIPEIPILEDLRLMVGQGIMLFMLAAFATSTEVRTAHRRLSTPLTPVLLLFLLAIFIAAMVGIVFNGVFLSMMVDTARPYSFYLMFFVGLLCLRNRRAMNTLLAILLVMATIVALLMFVQFAAGDHFKVFLGKSVRVEVFGGYAGRILPPGTELIWMTVPFVISRIPISSAGTQRVLISLLAMLLGGLLLTFTRSVWMGTLFSMVIMAVLGRGAVRRGVLRMFLALGIFVAVLLVFLQLVSTTEENYMTPYVKRFTSIFDPESYEEGSSADARRQEIKAAWPKIVENPWFGVGVGGTYNYVEAWDEGGQRHFMRPVSYIHNAYFLLLTHTGFVGFSTCMCMYLTFFMRARKIFRRLRRPDDRAVVMAAIGAIASVMLASIMQPSLWYPPAVPCIGLIFALVELVRYFSDMENGEAGPWRGALRTASAALVQPLRPGANPAAAYRGARALVPRAHRPL